MKKFFYGMKYVFFYLLLIFASVLFSLTHYLKTYFNSTYFEQLLYNFFNMQSLNLISIHESIYYVILGSVIFLSIFSIPLLIPCFVANIKFYIPLFKSRWQIFPVNLKWYSLVIFIFSLCLLSGRIGLPSYLVHRFSNSSLYEDYYVPYEKENVIFPDQKKNLIYIYIESFENSVFSVQNGGLVQNSYAPNMEKLALDYVNFSNTDKIGGFQKVNGTNWTAAAMVAQTSGLPIYIKTKSKQGHFLEGATSLGDILLENGYQNYLVMGSDARFADRKLYFSDHGNYSIFDYIEAQNNQKIDEDYFVWWGFEDSKLYDFSKEMLLNISHSNQPFNFTLLTADTHYFNGYLDKNCPTLFPDPYANSFYCMDKMLFDFINWIQKEDFYENTTIVIAGDHLMMRDDFFKVTKDYDRTVFNLFINSSVQTELIKNRNFTAFDMFPTTLASLGVSITDERLGLGTNLFSEKKTLSEEIGYEKFAQEIKKNSKYYQKEILKER